MPKGYVIAHINVHDPEKFAIFREMSSKVVKEFGGTILVRNPTTDQREGQMKPVAIVVEFPDIDTARRFYESKAYTEALVLRLEAATTDLMIVEGL